MTASLATLRDVGCLAVASLARLPLADARREAEITDACNDLEALLTAANAGDAKAFARFLTAVMPLVRKVVKARGRGLPPDQHDDVVQEVLLAIHLKRQTWDPRTPVRPWLYAVARYKVVDAFRRLGAHIHLPVDDFADLIAQDDPSDLLSDQEASRMLAQIDTKSAAIVRAIGLDGDRATEVGARLSMSEGAVRVAFHRAIKKLSALARGTDR